ncbi:MAG: cysteine desulfurase [Planctomycetota bacterium]
MKRVYLDHNATTPLRPEVRECLIEGLDRFGANASSVHAGGRAARGALDSARLQVAEALGVGEEHVIFTSGGTESDNLAILGSVRPLGPKAGLVTSLAEHSAVIETARQLEREGHPVRWLPVDEQGCPRLDQLEDLQPAPALVSLMAANNEVGSLTALDQARSIIDGWREPCPLHTDAVQALGRIPLDLSLVDLASFSAHKVGGPVGVGVLVRRGRAVIEPTHRGGGQEHGFRPGTENVPAIIAGALAIDLAQRDMQQASRKWRELCAELWSGIEREIPGARLLGPGIESPNRLPNTINVLLPDVDGRVLVTRLDLAGLETSTGSACASGSLEASHVLRAMGLNEEQARAGVRLSLGRETSLEDIHIAVERLRITRGLRPNS